MIKGKSLIKTIRFLLCTAIIAFVCAAVASNIGYTIDIADADSSASAQSYQMTANIYEADNYNSENYTLTSKYGGDNQDNKTNYGYVCFQKETKAYDIYAGTKNNTVIYSAAYVWTAPEDGTFNTSTFKPEVLAGSYGVKVAFVKGSTDENGTTTLTSMITGEAFGDYAFDGFWITVPANSSKNQELVFSSYIKGVSLKQGEFIMVFCRRIDGNDNVNKILISTASNASLAFNNKGYKINGSTLDSAYVNYFNGTSTEFKNVADIIYNGWSYKFVKLLDSYTVTEKVEGKDDARYTVDKCIDFTLSAAPTVEGKVFVGWDIGGNVLKNAGDKISVAKDTTVNAVFADFSTEGDAYFRLVKDSTGIRFVAKVKTADITDLEKYGTVSFGMKITSKTSGLENGGLDMAVSTDDLISGEEYSTFHCAIVNFFESTEGAFKDIDLYNAEFVATAYVTVTTDDGSVTAETNSSNAKSVAKMADSALNDVETEADGTYAYTVEGYEGYYKFDYSKEELDVIKGFADKYVASQENA